MRERVEERVKRRFGLCEWRWSCLRRADMRVTKTWNQDGAGWDGLQAPMVVVYDTCDRHMDEAWDVRFSFADAVPSEGVNW